MFAAYVIVGMIWLAIACLAFVLWYNKPKPRTRDPHEDGIW